MASTRLLMSVSVLAVLVAGSASAGPTSHAMEVASDGSVYFVDFERNRLLRFHDWELSVASDLDGVPAGDHLQNLVLTLKDELYIGVKKTIWKIDSDGSVIVAKPPKELKVLFGGRPGDLGLDGSVYLARDFKSIERSMPGGDTLPVLITDNISKILSMAVTPFGRIFFSNNTEVAKLQADGTVQIITELRGDTILGLAALRENECLLLRQDKSGSLRLEFIDTSGDSKVMVSAEQIASATSGESIKIESPR